MHFSIPFPDRRAALLRANTRSSGQVPHFTQITFNKSGRADLPVGQGAARLYQRFISHEWQRSRRLNSAIQRGA